MFRSVSPMQTALNGNDPDTGSNWYVASLVDVIRLYYDVNSESNFMLFAATLPYYNKLSKPTNDVQDADEVSDSENDKADDISIDPIEDSRLIEPEKTLTAEKLGKLEDELANLRAMIAAVVTKQESATSFAPPPPPPFPPAPIMMGAGAPPPPPPPLPPGGIMALPKKQSLKDIMSQHKKKGQAVSGDSSKPSMADVLSKLGTVKLKSLARSPGGSVIRNSPKRQSSGPMDPAAMIAAALKRKFANRAVESSPGTSWAEKENEMAARRAKAMESKQQPAFGAHVLRKTKRVPMSPRQAIAQH